jgi:outer membrane protein TolC
MKPRLASVICLLFIASRVAALAGSENKAPRSSRDLTLDQAVELAMRQNPQILKQKQEIERTRGVIIEVRAQALPRIAVASSYTQQDRNLIEKIPDQPAFFQQDTNWSVSMQATQLIYSGGQVSAALRAARIQQDSSLYSLRDTIDQIIALVRTQFYQVLLDRALITVQEQSVRLLGDQLKDQQNRYEAGTVPRFNVLRAEVALANAQPDLIRARNNFDIAQLQLAKTLGLEYETQRPGQSPLNAVGELLVVQRNPTLKESVALAKERRPFLKVQRQAILSQVEQIKVALAGYQPRISANGGYEMLNRRYSQQLTDNVNGWFYGATGTWNIWDGLETHGKVKQARAQLESAKITYDDSVRQVELEVQQAYDQIQQAKKLMQSQLKNVEQAVEALRLASERLAAGAGTQLDVLDARTALTQAQTTELQARYDYNVALAEFDRATGAETEYADTFDDPLARGKSHAPAKSTH